MNYTHGCSDVAVLCSSRELLYVWEKKVCFQDKTTLNEVAVSLLFPPAKNEKKNLYSHLSLEYSSLRNLCCESPCVNIRMDGNEMREKRTDEVQQQLIKSINYSKANDTE